MEEKEKHQYDFPNAATHAPPAQISISNSPSVTRRLSSQFIQPTCPIEDRRRFSWVSLQGRVVNSEEASSAKSVKGGLSRDEVVAWSLFSPIHRILLVAIVAAATNNVQKSKQICSLKRSVDLRDQVLLSMQGKLDGLCEQVNTMNDRPDNADGLLFAEKEESVSDNDAQFNKSKVSNCGCCTCEHHQLLSNDTGVSFESTLAVDEMSKFKMAHAVTAEQEERRMSDLSDWASSVTSAADMQLNALGIEQDIYNLQRECEEKDATIKELSAAFRSADVAGSKRIAELEDVIRRKNMIITKLKKDMAVLEQKVVHLVRLRRPSSASSVNTQQLQLPFMTDNVLYDMDSTTSSSSSDSDTDMKSQLHTPNPCDDHKGFPNEDDSTSRSQRSVRASVPLPKASVKPPKQRSVSPLTENTMNQRHNLTGTTRPKHVVSTHGDMKRNRRRSQPGSRETTPLKRWA